MKRARCLLSGTVLCALLTLQPGTAGAGNWPRFRGPDGQGISPSTAIPSNISDAHYRWRTVLPGGGQSSPVVWEDTVFVTCSTGDGERELVCLDAGTGAVRWRYPDRFTPHRLHNDNTFVSSTPAVDAERVYLWWTDGASYRAAAIDHQGRRVWQRALGPFSAKFGSGASPMLAGGRLILAREYPGENSAICAVDPATGTPCWTLEREAAKAAYSTPATRIDGSALELICTSTGHGITAIDPADGRVRWTTPEPFANRCTASPIVFGDRVLGIAGSGATGKEAWVIRAGQPPQFLYAMEKNLPNVCTPVAWGDRIYLWSDRGEASCMDAETGAMLWSQRVAGRSYASPLWIGGRIFGIDRDGLMVILAAEDTYRELGRHRFEKGTDATPAVADDRLFVRLDDVLVCLGP